MHFVLELHCTLREIRVALPRKLGTSISRSGAIYIIPIPMWLTGHYRVVPGEIMRREVELDPQVSPEEIMSRGVELG